MIEWLETVSPGTLLWWNDDRTEVLVRNRDGTFRTVGRVVESLPADPVPDAVVQEPTP